MPANPTLAEILDTAERLEREATPGPWEALEPAGQKFFCASGDERWWNICAPGHKYVARTEESLAAAEVMANNIEADAAFIAFARTALPLLVAVARSAVEMREAFAEYDAESQKVGPIGPSVDALERLDERIAAFDAFASGGEEKTNG